MYTFGCRFIERRSARQFRNQDEERGGSPYFPDCSVQSDERGLRTIPGHPSWRLFVITGCDCLPLASPLMNSRGVPDLLLLPLASTDTVVVSEHTSTPSRVVWYVCFFGMTICRAKPMPSDMLDFLQRFSYFCQQPLREGKTNTETQAAPVEIPGLFVFMI